MEKIIANAPAGRIDPALKELWASALESERFVQGIGHLANGPKQRCCLGVLVEVITEYRLIPEGYEVQCPSEADEPDEGPSRGINIKCQGEDFEYNLGTVPLAWRANLGLLTPAKQGDENEDLAGEDVHDFLINRNDAPNGAPDHMSFAEIAKWIRANM